MTASSVDTAELPRVTSWATPAAVPRRVELRQARRQRQRFAMLGVLVLAMALVMTVAVLDMVR